MIKDIVGYEGIYQISDNADVIITKTGNIKKPWINNKGYKVVDLYKDGKGKHVLLHRLMAEAFVPNPNNYPIVLHKDNNKTNVDPDNLAWGTYSENNAQAIKDGLNSIPRPDNRKDFIIADENGNNIFPVRFIGLDTIVDIIGYGNTQIGHNLVYRHDRIKEGAYKGYYVERFK